MEYHFITASYIHILSSEVDMRYYSFPLVIDISELKIRCYYFYISANNTSHELIKVASYCCQTNPILFFVELHRCRYF